jgi:DNA invertase Pin-like site-specific DNA recombinase
MPFGSSSLLVNTEGAFYPPRMESARRGPAGGSSGTCYPAISLQVGIVSITQQIDMTGPIGQLFAALLFAIAEFQLSTMKENQAAGIALAKQRGVYKGRKKGTKKLKPEEVRTLRETLTVAQIVKLKDVTERTVYNIIEKTN